MPSSAVGALPLPSEGSTTTPSRTRNSRSASRGRRDDRRPPQPPDGDGTSFASPVSRAEHLQRRRRHTHSYVPFVCHPLSPAPPPHQAVAATGGRGGGGSASLPKKAATDRPTRRDCSAAVDSSAKCRAFVNGMLHVNVDADGVAKKAARRSASKSAPTATRRKPPADVAHRPPFDLNTRIPGYSSSSGGSDEENRTAGAATAAAGRRGVVASRSRKRGDRRSDASVTRRPTTTRRNGAKHPAQLVADEKVDFNQEWINSLRA